MSAVQVRCPGCQTQLKIPVSATGTNVKCPRCQKVLAIPTAATARPQPASAAAQQPVASPSTGPGQVPASPQFRPSYAPAQPVAEEPQASGSPKWLIPAIVAGCFACAGSLGAVVYGFAAFSRSAEAASAEAREREAQEIAQATEAARAQLAATAKANPVPGDWKRDGFRGMTAMFPPGAMFEEVVGPNQQLATRITGVDLSGRPAYVMYRMPVGSSSQLKLGLWLKNAFLATKSAPTPLLNVERCGIEGNRIRLVQNGPDQDPIVEVFHLPRNLIFFAVLPEGAERINPFAGNAAKQAKAMGKDFSEAFFASIELPDPSTISNVGTTLAQSGEASTDAPKKIDGAEIRRKNLYLEYRKYAGANRRSIPLPGVGARDAVDSMVSDINKNQVRAFMEMNNLNQKQLAEIIREGNNKGWGDRR